MTLAAGHGFGVIVGDCDYRASPDGGSLLGYSRESLADMPLRVIGFLREVAEPYEGQVPLLNVRGHRRAARGSLRTTTANSWPTLFGPASAEAIGLARAASHAKVPLAVSFTRDHDTHRLVSGRTVKDAIEMIDAATAMTDPPSRASTARIRWSSRRRSNPVRGSSPCAACGPTPQ
jgi:hypothetical protein